MENVLNAGKVSYEAASPLAELHFSEKIELLWGLVIDVLKVIVFSIPHWIDFLVHLFVSRPKKRIDGQVAVVTGAGNGIGRCIALRLAEEGCNVAVLDIESNAATKTAQEITETHENVKAKAYHIDITNYEAMEKLRTKIEKDLGSVSILINNAGLIPLLSLREGSEREVERIISVNVTANLLATRLFLPGMLQRRQGHVATVSSLSAFHPIPRAVTYTATKYAMRGFMEALAEEIRIEGYGDCVHFTSLHPYFVSTRKDLMNAVNLRVPAISAEETANALVNGMLHKQFYVVLPKSIKWFIAFVHIFPRRIQQLIRDIILREGETIGITTPKPAEDVEKNKNNKPIFSLSHGYASVPKRE